MSEQDLTAIALIPLIKIIDTFIFYNELDLLNFRFTELYDYVDCFVLVESTQTFTGTPKKLYYEENKDMFIKFADKIIHVIVDDMPDTQNAWDREKHQRDCITRGVNKLNLLDSDVIIISDVDEIPNTSILAEIKTSGTFNGIFVLEQDMYYYNITTKFDNKWYKVKILNFYIFKQNSPETIRRTPCHAMYRGGWHFSYFGDIDFIVNKINNFSHQEFNNEKFTNKSTIEKLIRNNKDLFFNKDPRYVPIKKNKFLPKNYKMLLNISNNICDDKMLAYYGKDEYQYNVTDIITSKFMNDNRIVIPKKCMFNHHFGDPCFGIQKELTIVINDTEQIIKEYNENDVEILISEFSSS